MTPAAPPLREDLLRIEGVDCDYDGQPAVRDLSLALGQGELGCLLGPSGCGKTTLLRAIAGFHPPTAGRIVMRGRDATHLPPEQRQLGFVFQDLALFPHLSVTGNVGFGLHRLPRDQRRSRIDETLALLGLSRFAERYPHELSGGQQQRVALARSLAPRPSLLLLDEPFSSLDAHLRLSLRAELRDVLKRLGIAAMLVTHDQEEAFAFADTVGVMEDGHLRQWAEGFRVYHEPSTAFVARFVGEGRFLRGEVVDAHSVRTTLGLHRSEHTLDAATGDHVRVLMRPDDLRPAANGGGIETTVLSAAFRGAETFYLLRLADGQEISALFPSHVHYAPGELLRVQTDLEHVVVFPPDEVAEARVP